MLLEAYMKLGKKNLGKQLGFYMKLVSGALIPFRNRAIPSIL